MDQRKNTRLWFWGTFALALMLIVLPTGIANALEGYQIFIPELHKDPTPTPDPGWKIEYFNNLDLSGSAVLTTYADVTAPAYDWGENAPASGVNADYFSARMSRNVTFEAGNYQICLSMDDMGRLWIDGTLVIDQWATGSDRGIQTKVWEGYLSGGSHEIVIEYRDYTKEARVRLVWFNKDVYSGWKAEYFNNDSVSGDPVLVQNETTLYHDWNDGSPSSAINNDYFSARYTKAVYIEDGGMYVFQVMGDDGARVWIDSWTDPSDPSIDCWEGNPSTTISNVEILDPGWYLITVEYHEFTSSAEFAFSQTYGATTYGYRVEYYDNANLEGDPVLVQDEYPESTSQYDLEYIWTNGSPVDAVSDDYFSMRWTHTLELAPGSYTFRAHIDDGCRIYIDGRLILDAWEGKSMSWVYATTELYGDDHALVLEYNELAGDAHVTFDWYKN